MGKGEWGVRKREQRGVGKEKRVDEQTQLSNVSF